MRKPTNGDHGNSINLKRFGLFMKYREELSNKKVELLTFLGFNFKRLAGAERTSEDGSVTALP